MRVSSTHAHRYLVVQRNLSYFPFFSPSLFLSLFGNSLHITVSVIPSRFLQPLLLVLTRDFGALSPRPTPPAPTIAPIERASPLSFTYSSLLSAARWCAISQTRRTKETVTPQLAKLLIYSLFNQINERVDAHFYAPVQLFMVYGNCPKHGPTHTHRPWPGPRDRPSCEAHLPDDRPFSFRRTPTCASPLRSLSLSTRSFVFPFRVRPSVRPSVRSFVHPSSSSSFFETIHSHYSSFV